jgi:RimJ/RimL family protein N-acetyltransferase
MPHEFLQKFVIIDYTNEMAIFAVIKHEKKEEIAGVGRYFIDNNTHTAEAAFAVRDAYQNKGIGTELLRYLTYLAQKQGLLGFTAEVLVENRPMLHVFQEAGFDMQKRINSGLYELKMMFRG